MERLKDPQTNLTNKKCLKIFLIIATWNLSHGTSRIDESATYFTN